MITLSQSEARRLALHSQGLARSNHFGTGRPAGLRTIEHLGYIQTDTIHVIERAHHHVLWTRNTGYRPEMLARLQEDRQVFEYWDHAQAYLPMRDFRYYLPQMEQHTGARPRWLPRDKRWMATVLDRISREGPLMARDFKPGQNSRSGPWWDWHPAKTALERCFLEGRLLISKRVNFQKVYDLPERVLPAGIDLSTPSAEELCRFRVRQALQAHGIVTAREISYLRNGLRGQLTTTLSDMLTGGDILEVRVEGLPGQRYFTTGRKLQLLSRRTNQRGVHLLSPFDNLIIQRKRVQPSVLMLEDLTPRRKDAGSPDLFFSCLASLRLGAFALLSFTTRSPQLFNYSYQLECYLPPAKRQFGYFALPIRWNGIIAGLLDPKADRKRKCLIIKNLRLDTSPRETGRLLPKLLPQILALARFNGCSRIEVQNTTPVNVAPRLVSGL